MSESRKPKSGPRGPRKSSGPGAGPRPFKPRGEGRPRPEGGPRGRSFRSREEGAAPRARAFRPREEGAAPRQYRPRTEGGAPRQYRPREEGAAPRQYRPRAEGGAPRSYRPREEGAAPRQYRPRAEGGAPRSYRPREEGAAPRQYRPRPQGPSGERPRTFPGRPGASPGPRAYRPREEGAAPRQYRPRPEGAPGARPRFERSGPREDRGPSRFDRGQEGAVNRSRPVYERDSRVRWRRDGRPSPATPPAWKGRRGEVSGVPVEDQRRRGPRATAFEGSAPPLPSDPREAALRILHAVDTRSAFSDRLLDSAHAGAGGDPRDRALLHELVKGALRWRGRLDWALDQRVHIGLQAVQPWIRNVLRLGAYQILMLDRIPLHAAVDESVKLAHKYGHPGGAGLVNSVLRRLGEDKATLEWPAGDDVESLCVFGSHPKWIVERWLARFGPDETRALLLANNRSVPTGLRVNALRGTREQLIERLAAEGVEARPAELSPDLVWVEGHQSPGNLKAFKDGWCTAQDESEALVGRVVAPKPHERLLDLCAAPGGKSTHLAELIGDEGEVWAMERDAHRVASLEATIARLGQHAIHVVHGDGRSYAFPMPFDRALVDAPCSGLGVLARRADARWRKGPEMFAELPAIQLELLEAAARRLAPGGVLVYSVCTFEPEETDEVVARFLAAHPEFAVESVAGSVPDAVVTPEGFMRVLPQRHGCDGSFAARLRRS